MVAEVSGYLETFSKASMAMQSMHYFVALGTKCVNYSKSSGFFTPNIGWLQRLFIFLNFEIAGSIILNR
jgi:hypothetical protein